MMSREIKFQAYQPHASLHRQPGMYEVTGLEFYPEHGGGEAFLAKPGQGAISSEYLEDIKLREFTGLKDKNGVEIWEGDILKTTKYDNELCEVIWSDDAASFSFYFFNLSKLIWKSSVLAQEAAILEPEVIGNIYENSELLK